MTWINPNLIRYPLFSAILALWERTDGRTDKASYRDAWMHLKKETELLSVNFIKFNFFKTFFLIMRQSCYHKAVWQYLRCFCSSFLNISLLQCQLWLGHCSSVVFMQASLNKKQLLCFFAKKCFTSNSTENIPGLIYLYNPGIHWK